LSADYVDGLSTVPPGRTSFCLSLHRDATQQIRATAMFLLPQGPGKNLDFVIVAVIDGSLIDLTPLYLAQLDKGAYTYIDKMSGVSFLSIDVAFPPDIVSAEQSITFGLGANVAGTAMARVVVLSRRQGILEGSWHAENLGKLMRRPLQPVSESWTRDLACQQELRMFRDGENNSNILTYVVDYASCEYFENSSCDAVACEGTEGSVVLLISLSWLIGLVS
jgi:hypothetical protein